jgi:hypothetical protein
MLGVSLYIKIKYMVYIIGFDIGFLRNVTRRSYIDIHNAWMNVLLPSDLLTSEDGGSTSQKKTLPYSSP